MIHDLNSGVSPGSDVDQLLDVLIVGEFSLTLMGRTCDLVESGSIPKDLLILAR